MPGGPQKIRLPIVPDATSRVSAPSGPVRCSWPATSASVVGRRRGAGGRVGGEQVGDLPAQVVALAGLAGHEEGGPLAERHGLGGLGARDALLVVQEPQVAVGHVVPADGQAEPGELAEGRVRRDADRARRAGDAVPLEAGPDVLGRAAAQDRVQPDGVDGVAVGGVGDQVEVAVLQRGGGLQEVGRLFRDLLEV